MNHKALFTLESASKILPAVSNCVEKIVLKQVEIDSLTDKVEAAEEQTSNWVRDIRSQIESLYNELSGLVATLNEMGVLLKSVDAGLVDFPTLRLGEQVYLCWRIGEKSVSHWHGLDEGFVGRKQVVTDEFFGFGELSSSGEPPTDALSR